MVDGRMTTEEKREAKVFLEDILRISTVNGEKHEERLAIFIARYLQEHGIPAYTESVGQGMANVVARVDGIDPGYTLVLNGHLDTVPFGDRAQWDSDPDIPVERGGRLYARGASDMKSGLASLVMALCLTIKRRKRPRCSLIFLGTADEERGGAGAHQAVKSHILDESDAVIIAEPTGGSVGLAQKGCLWLRLSVEGRTSHGAYPWEGVNAIMKGFAFCNKLDHFIRTYHHELLGDATCCLSHARGGIVPNMVPDHAEFFLDIRTVPPLRIDDVLEKAKAIAAKMEKDTPSLFFHFSLLNRREAIETATSEQETIKLQRCIKAVTGVAPKNTGINFFTDASILTKNRPELPVILFGPGQPAVAHKNNEWVDLQSYYQAIQIYCCYVC